MGTVRWAAFARLTPLEASLLPILFDKTADWPPKTRADGAVVRRAILDANPAQSPSRLQTSAEGLMTKLAITDARVEITADNAISVEIPESSYSIAKERADAQISAHMNSFYRG